MDVIATSGVKQRLNIGLVTETYPPEVNGVAMTLGRLVDGLLSMGNKVDLYRPKQGTEVGGHSAARTGEEGFTEHLLRGLQIPMYKDLQLGLPAGQYLKKAWKQNRPDVLYVATEGPLGWSAIKHANRLGIPVVSGFHTNFQAYSQHYSLSWIEPLVFKYLKNLHNKTHCTLAPTKDMVNLLLNNGFNHAQVMQRGVDTSLYNPQYRSGELRKSWGADENTIVCLYVGRIAAEKNIEEAVQTVRILKTGFNIRFVLVGDGPLRKQLARENPEFIFTGTKRGEDLSTHYASGDVFLFPSHTETFGNVVTEAMASGLAVVAFNKAAAKERINDGENGVLVYENDGKQFQQVTEKLLSEPQSIKEIGEKAASYSKEHSWLSIVKQFETYLKHAFSSTEKEIVK